MAKLFPLGVQFTSEALISMRRFQDLLEETEVDKVVVQDAAATFTLPPSLTSAASGAATGTAATVSGSEASEAAVSAVERSSSLQTADVLPQQSGDRVVVEALSCQWATNSVGTADPTVATMLTPFSAGNAVRDVSFKLADGELMAVVGEVRASYL